MNLIAKKLVWTIDYDVFWRYSSNDGVYAPNASLIFPSGNVQDKFIGHQPATDFYHTVSKYLSFRAVFIWFITGDYMKQVSPGKDIVFLGLTSQQRFKLKILKSMELFGTRGSSVEVRQLQK